MEKSLNELFDIPAIERKEAKTIEQGQFKALKELLTYLSVHSKFYQSHFAKNNISIHDIKQLQDLSKIPPVGKVELRDFNEDFICIPKHQIIDYSTTSGTTGSPVSVALSNNDLYRLGFNEAISLVCANGSKEDIYQLTTTMDRQFMAGLAYFLGIRTLGCGIVRVGSGIPQLQIDNINRVQPNVLIAVPSFLIVLIEYAKSIGFDLNKSSVKRVICIGESIRNEKLEPNALHQKITEDWQVELFSTYASTEMGTAYTECQYKIGGHEHPGLIISELLDENDQLISDPLKSGELCITTLGVEGTPLLRFKTGDIVQFFHEECKCGRKTKRIGPVLGRKNQMIKYKGTTLYPPIIFEILNSFKEIEGYVMEVKHNEINTDEVIIYVSSSSNNLHLLLDEVANLLLAKIRVKPKVFAVSAKEIHRLQIQGNSRKPLKFIDSRK